MFCHLILCWIIFYLKSSHWLEENHRHAMRIGSMMFCLMIWWNLDNLRVLHHCGSHPNPLNPASPQTCINQHKTRWRAASNMTLKKTLSYGSIILSMFMGFASDDHLAGQRVDLSMYQWINNQCFPWVLPTLPMWPYCSFVSTSYTEHACAGTVTRCLLSHIPLVSHSTFWGNPNPEC